MGTVQDILQTKGSSVVSIEGHGTVRDAARVMNASGVGTLVVTEGGGVVGLLQDPRHDPGRPGVPAARRRRLLARQVTTTLTQPSPARGRGCEMRSAERVRDRMLRDVGSI